jgi:hypothetical protein
MSDDHNVLRVVRPQALVPQLAAESLRDAILSGRLDLGISRP